VHPTPSKKLVALLVVACRVILASIATVTPLAAASSEKVAYFFGGRPDGAEPLAGVIFDSSGNLYGTTYLGGTHNSGTVYELMPNNGQWTEKVLHSFLPKYGAQPAAGLIMDGVGNLYGTLSSGGTHQGGSVFELVPNNGEWTFKVLYSFINNGKDGIGPGGGLIFDAAGKLYGATYSGGAHGDGTVFELINNGKWTEKVLHNFHHNGYDGYNPVAGLVLDNAGHLYGTTTLGGVDSSCHGFGGCGTVFEFDTEQRPLEGDAAAQLPRQGDGAFPDAGLILTQLETCMARLAGAAVQTTVTALSLSYPTDGPQYRVYLAEMNKVIDKLRHQAAHRKLRLELPSQPSPRLTASTESTEIEVQIVR
jgi:uncharacterized repeat protein (TIGR03803 family)